MVNLSVIVITHNEERVIAQCLEALFGALKNVHDYEVIVVDSCSRDRTVEIARRFAVTVIRLRERQRTTAGLGRYIGQQHAQGSYIFFLDGDSVPNPSWLRKALDFLGARPDVDAITGAIAIGGRSRDALKEYQELWRYGDKDKSGPAISTSGTLLVRRSALEDAGGFNPHIISEEDKEFFLRLIKKKHAVWWSPDIMTAHASAVYTFEELRSRIRTGYHLGFGQTLRYTLAAGTFPGYVRMIKSVCADTVWVVAGGASLFFWPFAFVVWALFTAALFFHSVAVTKNFEKSIVLCIYRFLSALGLLAGIWYPLRTIRADTWRYDVITHA